MNYKALGINSLRCLPVVVTVLLLAACASDPNKEKRAYLNSGEKYYKAAQYKEAVIQFRNAIQIDPRFAAAHAQQRSAPHPFEPDRSRIRCAK